MRGWRRPGELRAVHHVREPRRWHGVVAPRGCREPLRAHVEEPERKCVDENPQWFPFAYSGERPGRHRYVHYGAPWRCPSACYCIGESVSRVVRFSRAPRGHIWARPEHAYGTCAHATSARASPSTPLRSTLIRQYKARTLPFLASAPAHSERTPNPARECDRDPPATHPRGSMPQTRTGSAEPANLRSPLSFGAADVSHGDTARHGPSERPRDAAERPHYPAAS